MTSEEIKARDVLALSTNGWLKEVAYQVALLNEKQAAPDVTRAAPNRPPVPPGSDRNLIYPAAKR